MSDKRVYWWWRATYNQRNEVTRNILHTIIMYLEASADVGEKMGDEAVGHEMYFKVC